MHSNQLLQDIVRRLIKYRMGILITALAFSIVMILFAWSKPVTYTARATLFPLTTPTDNQFASNALSGILGLGEAPKSFSSEATINIIELAMSRNVRERVSAARLEKFGNKTIAELLIQAENDNQSFLGTKIKIPADTEQLATLGGELLKPNVTAKMSKNGVLELYYTGNSQPLITPVSNVLIEKISQFYIDLKKEKAINDYNFTLGKIDSFQRMINDIDRRAIGLQRTTLFTPTDLLEYNLPKDNVNADKIRIGRQRDMSIHNRDEAAWRLQKVTPIIAVLDKPVAPFDEAKPSKIIFGFAGFIIGFVLAIIVLLSGLLYRYAKSEIYNGIFGENKMP